MKPAYRKYAGIIAPIWVGCFVLLLCAYMFLLAPQKKSKQRIEQKFAEVKQTYERTVSAADDEAKADLTKQVEDLRDRLGQFVIESEDAADLTFDISEIASEKQVTSFSIKSRDKQAAPAGLDSDHLSEKHIHISFTAGFPQFAGFLNAVERNRPVLFIDKFMIRRSDDETSGHQVNMDLAVFVRKQQES
jgi:Tfp pilus assembly protein PilO